MLTNMSWATFWAFFTNTSGHTGGNFGQTDPTFSTLFMTKPFSNCTAIVVERIGRNDLSMCDLRKPGANPTIVSYNASAVKNLQRQE
jgi:hypothetical protein